MNNLVINLQWFKSWSKIKNEKPCKWCVKFEYSTEKGFEFKLSHLISKIAIIRGSKMEYLFVKSLIEYKQDEKALENLYLEDSLFNFEFKLQFTSLN